MFERDYIMREVKKLMELLAKIAHLRTHSQHALIVEEVHGAYDRLGLSRSMVDFVDPATLIRMIGSAESTRAIGLLMKEEAEALLAQQDPRGEQRRLRAEAIILACEVSEAEAPDR